MNLPDIEIGTKYRCDYGEGQYYSVVIGKNHKFVCVRFGDKIGKDGDAVGPTERLGTLGEVWVAPECIHEM